MATNLFAPLAQSNKTALVEFKAGKMTLANNKVTPDKRKGLVQLTQSPDSLIHFIWKDRTTGNTEDDLIIFPEEATFKRISQCTTGRVYLLEFKSSSKKHFFWLQESKTDNDEENCKKINEYINSPPNPDQGATSGPATGLGGIDQNALFQMFGQARGGSSASTPGSSNAATNASIANLQNILTGMGVPSSTINNFMQRQQPQQQQQNTPATQQVAPSTPLTSAQASNSGASLSQIMNADTVLPLIMNNPDIVNQLLPLLPEERRTPEEIQSVLRSPQFQQSLEVFNSALQSGQLTDMIRQFNIQTNGGPQTIESFLTQLQSQAQQRQQSTSNTSSSNTSGDKEKKDDDKMDTN